MIIIRLLKGITIKLNELIVNNTTLSVDRPQTPLEFYRDALNILKTSKRITKEKALEILRARDTLQQPLEAKPQTSFDTWTQVIKEDEVLKKQAYKIVPVIDLSSYRESLPIDTEAWWWNLDSRESLHPWNRFDWLWRVIKLILLGVNFTLIGTIASRFLSGISGIWELGGLVFTTFISLLQAQNALSQARKNSFNKLMNLLKIKEHWYEEVQLVKTIIVFLILLWIWNNFSTFSEAYKKQAQNLQNPPVESQKSPNLALAEQKYLKALELDSDNLDAHFKLATLYEELQDIDKAKKHYLIAAKGGLLEAYNNLAYWYIREGKEAEAVELLETGKRFLAEKDKQLDKLTEAEKKELQVLRYNIYKNLGWARFKQERYEDAIPNLLVGISIAENSEYQEVITNPGAAYCIYAQILQKQEDKSPQAKENWQKCEELISKRKAAGDINAEEDQWLYEARQQLR